MATAPTSNAPTATQATTTGRRPRDLRLDFFRGCAMFIIFMAHTPGNPWTLWIPARFGPSDATEIFVFCSGMASALAFGTIFAYGSWLMGTARVSHRIWQVYWSHIGLFLAVAALLVFFNTLPMAEWQAWWQGESDKVKDYVGRLNLYPFFNEDERWTGTQTQLVGLLTLTYVPNYFDILPMYIAILFMVPVVMALAKVGGRPAVLAFVVIVYLGAQFGLLSMPAEPWSEREWFFNPFGWQLVFFTGFAFGMGWLPVPPVRRDLVIGAVVVLLLGYLISSRATSAWLSPFEALGFTDTRAALDAFDDWLSAIGLDGKTRFGIVRYIHFLALGYLAWAAVGKHGYWLANAGPLQPVVNVIRKVGTQSLAVFMISLVVAQTVGMLTDIPGRNWWSVPLMNLTGFAALIATAYTVSWYKSQPWRKTGVVPPRESGLSNAVEPAQPAGSSMRAGGGAVPRPNPAE